jgi:hypothetical protein
VGILARPPLAAEPEAHLDQPELQALEAGRRNQQVAELQEVERRHGLEHVELTDQQLPDLQGSGERMDDAPDIALLHVLAGKQALDLVELEQDLLEPQLVGLVHDNEQHLVMGRPAQPGAFGRLAGQQLIELQIVAVGHRRLGGAGHGGAGHGRHDALNRGGCRRAWQALGSFSGPSAA